MSGEFRIRDGLLAAYYLLFLTLNWFLPALFLWRIGEFIVVLFAFAGVVSVAAVVGRQFHEQGERRFNPFSFGAFLVLMLSLVAIDVWVAIESL